MPYLKLVPALILFLLPAVPVCAQATQQDWSGDYTLEQAGQHGTLHLQRSRRKCAPGRCSGFEARYTDDRGSGNPATVGAFDPVGQHLAFTIQRAGSTQPFDLYLVSPNRLAGTTVMQGATVGVIATRSGDADPKKGAQPAATAVAIDADGQIATKNDDGSTTYRKLSVCGSRTVSADGHVTMVSCMQVLEALPTDPPSTETQGKWLRKQDDALLSIIQSLLDSASYQNYLAKYETNQTPAVYKQISDRTNYITQLTRTQ